jgi:hypothetical protein
MSTTNTNNRTGAIPPTAEAVGFLAQEFLKVYKVSCCSECGTYFQAYLQSVTVVATDKKQAAVLIKKWLQKEGESFLRNITERDLELLGPASPGVIDYHRAADY